MLRRAISVGSIGVVVFVAAAVAKGPEPSWHISNALPDFGNDSYVEDTYERSSASRTNIDFVRTGLDPEWFYVEMDCEGPFSGGSDNYAIELDIDPLNESDRGDWLIYVGGSDALADSIWVSGKNVGKLCDGKKAEAFADKETDARRDVSRRVSGGLGREDNGRKRRSFSHLHVQTRDWRKE